MICPKCKSEESNSAKFCSQCSEPLTEVKPRNAEVVDEPYPPLLEYLESEKGHGLVSRVVSLFEALQKATIESAAEQKKQEMTFHHKTVRIWMILQSAVIAVIIVSAVALAWHGKLDATVAALMGTLFGYFLGRPMK
jgi:hypothetical protein